MVQSPLHEIPGSGPFATDTETNPEHRGAAGLLQVVSTEAVPATRQIVTLLGIERAPPNESRLSGAADE